MTNVHAKPTKCIYSYINTYDSKYYNFPMFKTSKQIRTKISIFKLLLQGHHQNQMKIIFSGEL